MSSFSFTKCRIRDCARASRERQADRRLPQRPCSVFHGIVEREGWRSTRSD